MRYNHRLLLIGLLLPILLTAQLEDVKIHGCINQYFRLNRGGPTLHNIEIFEHPDLGHTIKLKITSRRNRTQQDLTYGFTSAAAVANLHGHIEMLWVEMDVRFKTVETTTALASAECSIDALILGNVGYKMWWTDCLQIP